MKQSPVRNSARNPKKVVARTSQAENGEQDQWAESATLPHAAVALTLMSAAGEDDVIYIAADERRAEEIGRIIEAIAPDLDPVVFPPWDCLPFDRASPSRDSMGRRMKALQKLIGPVARRRLVITTVEAACQRVPPPEMVARARFELVAGEPIDVEALCRFAERFGYEPADRVESPGEFEVHGHVLDVFPPGAPEPLRLTLDNGAIREIHSYDPVTQRSTGSVDSTVLGPASEILPKTDEAKLEHFIGIEHRLSELYDEPLSTLFDCLPAALILRAPGTDERREAFLAQLVDAHATHAALAEEQRNHRSLPPLDRLHLDAAAWEAILARHPQRQIAVAGMSAVPSFASAAKPAMEFQTYLEQVLAEGWRVVLAGIRRDLSAFARHLTKRGGRGPEPVQTWADVQAAAPGSFLGLELDLDEGIVDQNARIALVAAADVLGTRAHHDTGPHGSGGLAIAWPAMKIGDTVIHEDHGLGVLRGLDTVVIEERHRDAARIDYHDGASLLVPVEDFDKVWRYGSDADAVPLDRLHTDAWSKRRIELEHSILATARHLVTVAEARRTMAATKLVAPERTFAKFTARFPYPLTRDQAKAAAAVEADLASGQPMDRLVCGDVGFGKTEIALRAAAIALMAGHQVAVVAPTTVLARQHLATFTKRLDGFGFPTAGLSRLETAADAKRVKAGLADGTIRLVVGTQAVASRDVAFKELGLVIIDEEQKFGAKLKADLRTMAAGGHVLTLTATPIPRTLQLALVGIQTVSVVATPPVRRRPVRTFLAPFDSAAVRTVLMRERARAGQSFVIVPRIADIEPMRERLAALGPELEVIVAHGDMSAEATDAAMVDFAGGRGDVLLATNIVESGLDVPRANTMLIWDAGQFGLAQLHQLRGRVGRSRAQGFTYLLTDPAQTLTEDAHARLSTLQGLDRLGAGFAISARDLDLRGAGDMLGDDQAGHLRLIGLELYQSLLARAVQKARGEPVDDAAPPELHLDATGRIAPDYIAEPDLRIEIYARLSRLRTGKAIRAFRAEVEDRFGPLPAETAALFTLARLRNECRRRHAAALSVGPRGVAMVLHPEGLETGRELAAARPDVTLKGAKLLWQEASAGSTLGRAEAFFDLLDGVT